MTLDEARQQLGSSIREDGSLAQDDPYYSWWYGRPSITIDGSLSLHTLQAIVVWMQAHVQEKAR